MFKSPSIENDAVAPPKVGSVNREIYGMPFSSSWASFADVLASCINEIAASIILAPPDLDMIIMGHFFLFAKSTARAIFSPTTDPIDPPINVKSIEAITIFSLFIFPNPVLIASFSPVFFCITFKRSEYFLVSLNFNGSAEFRLASNSLNLLLSKRILKYSLEPILWW